MVNALDAMIDQALAALKAEQEPVPEPTEEEIAAAGRGALEAGWLPHDRQAFHQLCTYLAGPQRLGLLLTGSPGVGKTWWMEHVQRLTPVRARDIVAAYRTAQNYDAAFWHAAFRTWDCEQRDGALIDDLGEEPLCMLYGQQEEVLSNVIATRYTAWKKTGARLFLTTNLTASELDRRYGRRVLDRLREMCLPVEITGGSNRRRRA